MSLNKCVTQIQEPYDISIFLHGIECRMGHDGSIEWGRRTDGTESTKEGYWNELEDGVVASGNYLRGKREGLWIERDKEGKKIREYYYQDDKYHGLFTEWWEGTNQKRCEGSYDHGSHCEEKWTYWNRAGIEWTAEDNDWY